MAGSQLKNLKAALKARGLTGQTNVKSKNKKNSKRQAKEYDREEKKKAIAEIREEFNPFEIRLQGIRGEMVCLLKLLIVLLWVSLVSLNRSVKNKESVHLKQEK